MAELKPANENPWYVLSTLHGEYVEGLNSIRQANNIRLWNIWACQNLDEEEREILRATGVQVPRNGDWELYRDEIVKRYDARMQFQRRRGFQPPKLPLPDREINMSKLDFNHLTSWRGAIFTRQTVFSHSTFWQDTDFESALFLFPARLDSIRFEKESDFSHSTFAKSATFRSTKFKGDVSFSHAQFSEASIFSPTFFLSKASFGSTLFEGFASFAYSGFKEEAQFGFAIFRQNVFFDRCVFEGRTQFVGTEFGRSEETKHSCKPDFRDAVFLKPASFRGAFFRHRYPVLFGTLFHENTQISAHEEHWPSGPQPNAEAVKEACGVLRHVAAKQGLPEDEYFFFRREMEFAQQASEFWTGLPYRLYGLFDYGCSIRKPAQWLFGFWILPAVLFTVVFAWQRMMHGREFGVLEGFGFSFANMFKFFGLQRVYFDDTLDRIAELGALGSVLETVAAGQTVFAYILLFFLGLGLRARFRLR